MEDSTATEEVARDPFAPAAEQKVALASYRYRNAQFQLIWHTSVPKDDEAALAYFHFVSRISPLHKPVYCEKRTLDENGHEKWVSLSEMFDAENLTTVPLELRL